MFFVPNKHRCAAPCGRLAGVSTPDRDPTHNGSTSRLPVVNDVGLRRIPVPDASSGRALPWTHQGASELLWKPWREEPSRSPSNPMTRETSLSLGTHRPGLGEPSALPSWTRPHRRTSRRFDGRQGFRPLENGQGNRPWMRGP